MVPYPQIYPNPTVQRPISNARPSPHSFRCPTRQHPNSSVPSPASSSNSSSTSHAVPLLSLGLDNEPPALTPKPSTPSSAPSDLSSRGASTFLPPAASVSTAAAAAPASASSAWPSASTSTATAPTSLSPSRILHGVIDAKNPNPDYHAKPVNNVLVLDRVKGSSVSIDTIRGQKTSSVTGRAADSTSVDSFSTVKNVKTANATVALSLDQSNLKSQHTVSKSAQQKQSSSNYTMTGVPNGTAYPVIAAGSISTGQQEQQQQEEVRNTNLDEISNAVTADCETSFQKSSFALKRTKSLGLFDASMRPSMAADLVGTMEDYPHLHAAAKSGSPGNTPAVVSSSSSSSSTLTNSYFPPISSAPNSSKLHQQTNPNPSQQTPSPPPSIGHVSSTTLKPEATDSRQLQPQSTSSIVTPALSASSSSTLEDDEHGSYGSSSPSIPGTPEIIVPPLDDSVIQYEPSRHVDYLSHNWKESDISSSWRYIVLRRKDMANSARLENASWRTWTKAKYNLKTVAPESVNWLKDYDVTWLYGPLYDEPHHTYSISPDNKSLIKGPGSKDNLRLDKGKSVNLHIGPESEAGDSNENSRNTSPSHSAHPAKPILKKRSVSQMMLSRPPLITHNSCNGTPTCNCTHHRNMTHEAANAATSNHSTGDGVSTYLRHHNYRHRPHAGHSNENISHLINQQYYQAANSHRAIDDFLLSPSGSTAGDSSSISSISSGTQGTSNVIASNAANHGVNSNHETNQPSPPPAPAKVRHIHFNNRVEQCIAVDHSFSDDEDEEGDRKMSDRGRSRHSSKHKKVQSEGRPQFGLGGDSDDSDSEQDEDEYDDEDEDEEIDDDNGEEEDEEDDAGFFFMVRSASSASIHNLPKGSYRNIALLPATTLKYQVDEAEREARQQATANSVAFAMSHNTVNHRHAYSTYDYNSVYVSPAPSPSHSPSHSLSSSDILQGPTGNSIVSVSTTSPTQTDTTNAVGELSNSYSISTTVLLDSLPSVPAASSQGATTSFNDMNVPESEFVEDTSAPVPTKVTTPPAGEPLLSLGLQAPPPTASKTVATTHSSQVNVVSSDNSPPPSRDESPAAALLEDNNRPRLGRINSAVSSAKGLANSLWNANWK
ncbi:protein phosphatase regulator REG1 [Sugiyamaella lignohabitans]|uniref:Protein phosphatase regulator REG1 n=1 Tax=Sugiyamaella lignohabitans TaxID=796027 RepID=A0A161HK74_9ASCO|nr:protein phosphatase regulator REG1 [Sugiyamaella lignohabitans]ANB13317.1 protein phosphatase regulator REG1 [Sugiyamaella lignohabitans]